MTETRQKIILSIETAIGGGSFSIFNEKGEIDFFINEKRRSRAEDLLSDIQTLLKRNKIKKNEIIKILFSSGPGSQTGIRIGAATAKGLMYALGCDCQEISVLEALVFKAKEKGIIQTCVQVSQNGFCRQFFEYAESVNSISQPEIINIDDYFEELNIKSGMTESIVLSEWMNTSAQYQQISNLRYCDSNENIAHLLYLAYKSQNV